MSHDRPRNRRRHEAFSLLEVVLALAILSVALSTLLIARNRSIIQLRTSGEQIRLRAAAADALGRQVLAARFPDEADSPAGEPNDIAVTVDSSAEQRSERAVLHRIEVTARYRERQNVPAFTLATAVVTAAPEEQDEQVADDQARGQR